ncbi:flavin adenine dinucleotide transporter [Saccharomycopsis crataegensis]|uniref:Flavin adenine dinucleotide transporter n=1 Tax=Saccharomycopsis crataegensis TaxID=43959 RepID=A0AAV5QE67_9ASCO|nr:flavin adenine dinucleotide transporter [Saccharomycopsis crataegensis]
MILQRYLFFFVSLLFHFNTTFADTYIETSSLLTCMKNSQLTASYFNVIYTPNDTKVVFDISAITTITGKVRASIEVIAYGLTVVTQNVSLCDLGFSTLCPMSAGRIDVDSNYVLSSSYTKEIPSISYFVPDLDAKVKVTVYDEDSDNNTALACVEAILSNGKTVQTRYASWPIAAISGFGLITSGVISVTGHSSTAAHIASNSLSLFVYFQNLAISSMMAVNTVPPIAAAWCQNFQWSMGIIHLKALAKIANWYVQATGGTATSVLANKDILSISVQKKLLKRSGLSTLQYLSDIYEKAQNNGYLLVSPKYKTNNVHVAKRDDSSDALDDSSLYTSNEKNSTELTSKILVLRGIQRVAYLADIEITSLFFTSMAFTILFAFVLVVALAVFKGIVELLIKSNVMNEGKFGEYRLQWRSIIKGSMYRLFLIGLPQVTVLCLWELTERDSVACVVMAIVLLVLVLGILTQAAIKLILIGKESVQLYKNPAYSLYGDPKVLNKYGFLYVQYSAGCYYWVMVSLTYIIIKSLIIGILQGNGKIQAVIVFAVELIYLIALCAIRPYMDKRTNAFNILIHVFNLINSIFFLIFSEIFGAKAAVISISGVVLFVVNAVFSLILLIFTIWTCTKAIVYKNPDAKYTPVNDDRVCFIKPTDGEEKVRGGTELDALGSAALRGHEDVDLTKTLSHQYTPGGTKLGNNVFEDDEYEDKFPSSRLPTGGRNRADSLTNSSVVQPGSMIYQNHGASASSFGVNSNTGGGVSRPMNTHNESGTGYQGMDNYGSRNMYPYDASGSSTNLGNPYGNQGNRGYY